MNFTNTLKNIKITISNIETNKINLLIKKILKTNQNNKKVIIAGNGGSSATASHVAVDLTKNAKIKCINFNEYDLITCFANDFGYENWLSKAIEFYAEKGDLLILLSCSGNSKNLVNCIKVSNKMGVEIATLTGCDKNNSLKLNNAGINIWVKSSDYNVIEANHHIILLSIVNELIEFKNFKIN
jgi:D-sedoheptulose 7-phosphate isomerase